MMDIVILAVTLFVFIIASLQDIKEREVYDFVNFSYFFFILFCSILDSMIQWSFEPFYGSIIGTLFGFIFGSLLYYGGLWGGGDAKFLLGFGASTPYLLNFLGPLSSNILTSISINLPYALVSWTSMLNDLLVFINIIIALTLLPLFLKKKTIKKDIIAILGILLFLTLSLIPIIRLHIILGFGFIALLLIFFADEKIFSSCSYSIQKKERRIPILTLILINLIFLSFKVLFLSELSKMLLYYFFLFLIMSFAIGGVLAIVILFYFFVQKRKQISISFTRIEMFCYLSIVLIGIIFTLMITSTGLIFLLLPLIHMFVKVAKETEKVSFTIQKPISDLVPGDWIVNEIKHKKKILFTKEDLKLGITEDQIKKLKKLFKGSKTILVKDGLAFIPSLFLGFLFLVLI